MTEIRTIAVAAVAPGMQVKAEGLWWQVQRIMDNGDSSGTMTLMVKRVRNSEFVTAAQPRLLWLPITRFGALVRAGTPMETTVGKVTAPKRVLLKPRSARDPKPYLDGHGKRYGRTETASHRRIAALAAAFEQLNQIEQPEQATS